MHESITLQMLQFFFFYTRSLGNGNSKFRLWKQLKNLQKKLRIISTKKKKCSTILTISILGKKVLLHVFQKHLLYLVFPNLVCQTWNTDAKFLRPTGQLFFSKVTRSSTGQHQWSPNFGVIYPVTRPTGCLLSQFWRNFCPKAIQSKSVDVALHLWAKKNVWKTIDNELEKKSNFCLNLALLQKKVNQKSIFFFISLQIESWLPMLDKKLIAC